MDLEQPGVHIDGPVHADRHFVELGVFVTNEEVAEALQIRGFIACSARRVKRAGGRHYEIAARELLVVDNCSGGRVVPHTMIQDIVQPGSLVEVEALDQSGGRSGTLSIGSEGSLKQGKPAISSSLRGEASSKAERKRTKRSEVHSEVARVSRVAGAWRIGERAGRGDPLRGGAMESGGALDGIYMEKAAWASYAFDKHASELTVSFDVVLPIDRVRLSIVPNEKRNGYVADATRATRSLVRGPEVTEREERQVLSDLKDFVSGFVLQEELTNIVRELNSFSSPEQLVLAHATIVAKRELAERSASADAAPR